MWGGCPWPTRALGNRRTAQEVRLNAQCSLAAARPEIPGSWTCRGVSVRWLTGVEGSVPRMTRIVSLDLSGTARVPSLGEAGHDRDAAQHNPSAPWFDVTRSPADECLGSVERCSELIGCPISRSLATSCVCLELRPLPSPGVTRLQRYYKPLRHPTASACPSRASGWSSLTALWRFPCCVRFPCVRAAASTPVQRLGVVLAHLTQP